MVDFALRNGRAAAERRMRGTCRVERLGPPTTDGVGGVVVPRVTVFEGRCYVRYPGLAHEQNFDSAGVAVSQSRVIVRIPFGPVINEDDVVTILSDPDTPHLAGTVLRVASIDDQSQATAQRLLCEDNQAGVRSG